jgi:hypothetical protein
LASSRYTGDDSDWRGWIVHDARFDVANISASDSSYTEAGPRAAGAGDPADVNTAAVVEAIGDQDTSLYVQALQGGLPRLSRGMRVGYRLASDAATKLRGWQPPNAITGCWPAIYSTNSYDSLTGCVLRTGDVLIAYRQSGGTLNMRSWSPATAAWTTSITEPVTDCSEGVALTVDPDGHILVLLETPAATPIGWSLYRSDEPDTTESGWTEISRHPFTSEPTASTDRMRLFVMPTGDIVLIGIYAVGGTGTIRQWASSDGGASFTAVDSTANATTNLSDAILTPGGRIGVVRVTSGNVCNWHSSASAWSAAMDSTAVQIATSVADAWACSDPNGRIWVWTRSSASADRVLVHYSDDEGASWTTMDHGLTNFLGDTGQYLTGGIALHSLGAHFLLHQSSDDNGNGDTSPILTRCGGWSNVVIQNVSTSSESGFVGSGYGGTGTGWSGCMWLPVSEADDLSCWTAAGTGGDTADSINSSTGRLAISTSASTRYFDATTAPPSTTDIQFVEWDLIVGSGGSTTTFQVGVSSRLSDGVDATEIQVWASTTAFAVRNHTTQLASVTVDMTVAMQFRIIHRRGSWAEVYYRRPYESTWTQAYSSSSLTTTASATAYLRWGHNASSTSDSTWGYLWHRTGEIALFESGLFGSPLSSIDGMDWMSGRLLTGLAAPVDTRAAASVGEGTRVTKLRGADGPARAGDSWTLAPVHDHPVENVLPLTAPSPRRTWRSTQTAADEYIGFVFDSTNDTSLSRHIGFAAFGCNVRYLELEAWDGAAWSTRATLDLATGFTSLDYTRSGNVLRINGTADATRYVWRNELVGATVSLGGGKYRKIARHTEGIWSDAAGKHVEIVLEGVDGTEAASGTMDIWCRSGFVAVHNESSAYDKWRINVPAGSNADGFFEIGTIVCGPLVIPGQSFGWGEVQTYEPNAATYESRDRVTRVRRLSPTVRTWTWAWPDGIDISRLRDANPTPDYLAHTAPMTEGVANLNDVPYLVAGLLEECRSGEIPVVACAYVSTTSGTSITDPTLFLGPARIISSVGIENIQGDPESDAVVRVSPITMQEIP